MVAEVSWEPSHQLVIGYCHGGVENTAIFHWDLNWDQLLEYLKQPITGPKDGTYITRCAFENDSRNDSAALDGYLAILDGDSQIDPESGEIIEGAPDPKLVHEVLKKLNITHCIYTSHSNGGDKGNRYRVLMPVPIANKKELEAIVGWTIEQLFKADVYLNPVKENLSFSQPWYLPRVPDAEKAAMFRYYQHTELQPFPKQEALSWYEESTQKQIEPNIKNGQAKIDPNSPIGKFNSEHGHEWMGNYLIDQGYEFSNITYVNGYAAHRYEAPGTTSGSPGVVLFFTERGQWRIYSHHGEHDPLADGFARDAFDIYTLFGFEGDQKKALESLDVSREISHRDIMNCDPDRDEDLVDSYYRQEQKRFNAKHGMLMLEGKSVVVYRELNRDTNEFETKFSTSNSMSAYWCNKKLPKVERPREGAPFISWPIRVFDDWLDSYTRRTYQQTEFKPETGLLASTIMPETGGAYNLYLGANFLPAQGDCYLIISHIYDVWCNRNDELYWYVIKWFARMIQEPQLQGRTVLVLRSGQGVGKNIILDIFDRYYGSHSVMLSKPEDLAGFNDHLATSVFVFLNEALWGGNRSHEGSVKTIITDDKLQVERKYIPKFKIRNCTHIVVATNNDWAVPVGIDDRRFLIMDLSEEHRDDMSYFDKLVTQINNGGQEAFIHYLMNEVDLTGFDVRKMPQTESVTKLDHKVRTADSITRWWIDVLTEGGFQYIGEEDILSARKRTIFIEWDVEGSLVIEKSVVYDSYCQSIRGQHIESKHSVTKKIAELLGTKPEVKRSSNPGRPWNYVFPSLSNARENMDRILKQKGPWHTE